MNTKYQIKKIVFFVIVTSFFYECSNNEYNIKYYRLNFTHEKDGVRFYYTEIKHNEIMEKPYISYYKFYYDQKWRIIKEERYASVHIDEIEWGPIIFKGNISDAEKEKMRKESEEACKKYKERIDAEVEELRFREPEETKYYLYDHRGELIRIETIDSDQ